MKVNQERGTHGTQGMVHPTHRKLQRKSKYDRCIIDPENLILKQEDKTLGELSTEEIQIDRCCNDIFYHYFIILRIIMSSNHSSVILRMFGDELSMTCQKVD